MNNFLNINLENMFNHKAFLESKELMESSGLELQNQGQGTYKQFFRSSNYPKSNELLYIEDVPFLFPDKSPHAYDNIRCMEQIIYTTANPYSKIHFLGFAEFNQGEDFIKLIYEDNYSDNINISIFDWGTAGHIGENKTIKFQFNKDFLIDSHAKAVLAASGTHDAIVGCTYYEGIIPSSNKKLKEIHLPDNIFLHIIAITLE